ncbi:hypothetical protein AVEN_139720-1 [Araneus ventricosus]|uniref:Endonuclease/exonuclease/phosphatase domain-containing protein n=1 Tax=Araneus ventricosus TaxID=182803 RepID=A0A4Y2IKF5_ARAVE|nr:hypothetical protein AVEN_139720-1 [Araneus ventricosus]
MSALSPIGHTTKWCPRANDILCTNCGLNSSAVLHVGDFNARSQIWGFQDHRERVISEFISSNNFTIRNRTDQGPTFISSTGHVFLDLSLISTFYRDLLDSWKVLDLETLSDHSISGPNWGTGVSLSKHWYSAVIQPSLLFGAAVWGGSFTQQQILTLHTVQRVALLKIAKAYRTCPTNALNVILGIPPLHVVANALFIKFQIWFKRNNSYDFIDISDFDYFIKINNINLNSIEFPVSVKNSDFDVYTDGFGIDGNVGAAVSYKFKLSSYNSVFQAEVAAINFATGWALENSYKINIFTDSLSSIQVLKKSNSKSHYINEIKRKMFCALGSVDLSWAHARIPGNELADQYAKAAILDGEELLLIPFFKNMLILIFLKIGSDIRRTPKGV